MATKTQEWLVFTPEERLIRLKDYLRAAEDVLWGLNLTSLSDPTRADRIKTAQAEVDELQSIYKALMKEIDGE